MFTIREVTARPKVYIPDSTTLRGAAGYQASPSHVGSTSSSKPSSRFAVHYVHGFRLMLTSDTPLSGHALALVGVVLPSGNGGPKALQSPAWNYGLCVMPGTR
jgi:hypothetical protein